MNWFEKVQRYYNAGFYNNKQVEMFVLSGKITKEEYAKITGEDLSNI